MKELRTTQRYSMPRRRMLAALGGLAASAPFLRPSSVFANEVPPKRVVFFLTGSGTYLDAFVPAGGAAITSTRILAPLAAYESKLTLLRGIDHPSTTYGGVTAPDHRPDFCAGMSGFGPAQGPVIAGCTAEPGYELRCREWTNRGTTIDRVLAPRLAPAGGRTTPLHLGVRGHQGGSGVSFEANRAFRPQNDPVRAASDLFGTATDLAGAARERRRRTSVLDAVRADAASMRCRMGSEHRASFDDHLQAISELESTLAAAASCERPEVGAAYDANAVETMPTTARLQAKVMGAAFRCDLARVGLIDISNSQHPLPYLGRSDVVDWHNYVHGIGASLEERMELQTVISNWFAQQLAILLGELDGARELDGSTILDNTLVVWVHEQSRTHTHGRDAFPYLLAGSAGGAIRTGRYVQLDGRANNDLLLTICHALGQTDIEEFGEPEHNTGPITEVLV